MSEKMSIRIRNKTIPFWLWIPGLLVAMAGLAAGVYFGIYQPYVYKFIPRNWGVVEEGGFYRSGQLREGLVEKQLRDYKIQTVIVLYGENLNDPKQVALLDTAKKLNVEIKRFPMKGDGTPGDGNTAAVARYAQALAAVAQTRKEGKVLLVQCMAGTHRTGGIVATYRMLIQGKPAKEAYAELCHYGWDPEKHQDLLKFLNPNMGAIAAELVKLGVLAKMPDPIPVLGP